MKGDISLVVAGRESRKVASMSEFRTWLPTDPNTKPSDLYALISFPGDPRECLNVGQGSQDHGRTCF